MDERTEKIIEILKDRYDVVSNETLSSSSKEPYEVLVSTVISQRNRDEMTRKISEKLLEKADNPEDMVELGRKNIEESISSANYYKTKAKYIYTLSKELLDRYGGEVPDSRDELMSLTGVGGKTADIVLLVCFEKDIIPVDTHVLVTAYRLGWTEHEKHREKVRKDLHNIFPKEMRAYINLLLVRFGKDVCKKYKPRCGDCPVFELCPYDNKNI